MGFEYPKTCPRLKIVIKALLLWLGNMTHSYMQSIKSLSAILYKSNIRYADELQYISQMSAIDVYDYVKHLNLK